VLLSELALNGLFLIAELALTTKFHRISPSNLQKKITLLADATRKTNQNDEVRGAAIAWSRASIKERSDAVARAITSAGARELARLDNASSLYLPGL
jgi:hypothetical protein